MMNVIKITYSLMDANTYMLYWDDERALLIDCVPNCYNKVQKLCKKYNKRIVGILLTHGHIDHMADAVKFQKDGVKIFIASNDSDKLYTDKNLGYRLGLSYEPTNADGFLNTDRYNFCGHYIDCIETPGHSAGSMCYFLEGVMFTGDTLFKNTVGRTDFEDGDPKELAKSLRYIKSKYPKTTAIYPGHGIESTLELEEMFNPYYKIL